jgi:hypothetical protein
MISVNADFGKKIVSIHTIGVLGSEVLGCLEDRGLRFEANMVRFFFASNLKRSAPLTSIPEALNPAPGP